MAENETTPKLEEEKSQEKTLVPMTEAQKSAERITESVLATLDEAGHELDTEEDGDIFWIIQKVAWSILKSVFVISLIGFLMWAIWGDMDNLKMPSFSFISEKSAEISKKIEKKVFIPTKKEKIPEKKDGEITTSSIQAKTYQSVIAARWNIWMGEEYRKETKGEFGKATLLLQDSDDLFSVPLPLQIKGRNSEERASKIKILLEKMDSLMARYKRISGIFSSKISTYSVQLPLLEEDSRIAESQFLSSVIERRSDHLESYIQRKIQNGNKQYEIQNQVWARQVLLQEIDTYWTVLENLKANIKTNEKALIHDVQVYDFLNDPFQRVLK